MLRRLLPLPILFLLAFASVLAAQSGSEAKFNAKQAKVLHKYSESAFKDGFPRVAKRVWLMLLSEYDPNHAQARAALGYERVGDSWSLDPSFVYPKHDKPDPNTASKLQKKWEAVSQKVANAHRKKARIAVEADRTDLSQRHFEKVIFFVPDDEEAQAALNHKPVAGLTGTDNEQILYERSKMIEEIVAAEARKDYPVEKLDASDTHPFLEKAKVSYITVKSEHFKVRGDFEPELLIEAAKNAERAVRVMEMVVKGYKGFNADPRRWVSDWAFFQDKNTYVQVLKANADLMEPDEMAFRIEHTRGCTIVTSGSFLEISAPANEQGVYDGAVRNVAQAFSNLRTAALREGIGHTIVGHFFNNNRAFIVDRKKQLETSTGEEDIDKYSPNMDTWGDLALEAAWKLGEGTPAAQLPLIDAAKFPDDARIKSWSFCDYIVRRDPTLLLDLDRLADLRHIIRIEEKFTEDHDGLSIADLEKEWKDYWTEASPVLKAIRNNTPPLSSVSKDVKKWLTAFNKARKEQRSADVTWSDAYSGRCREHAEYLLASETERGPEAEQRQNIELPGGSHLGDMFAQMALVSTSGEKSKRIFKTWLDYPGYRDALLNRRLQTIGLYSQDSVLVLDCIRGVGSPPAGQGGYRVYPDSAHSGVPTRVQVSTLGPELRAFLDKNGHGDKTEVGYPISLHHFGNGGLPGSRGSYRCSVTVRDEPVEGILHFADGGTNRRTSAPGMVVFYPLEPLKKGVEVKVVWTFETETQTSRKEAEFDT